MLFEPYSNLSIHLASAPMICFYKQESGNYMLRLGQAGSEPIFTAKKIEELKEAITSYNEAGGRYYWLYNNIAINLDIVSMVWTHDKRMIVEYPGGVWSSLESDETAQYYQDYLNHLNKEEEETTGAHQGVVQKPSQTGALDEKALQLALENIDRMIGLNAAKKEIRQSIAVARFNAAKAEIGMPVKPVTRHMVFSGNPGTGKTTFAREVAKIYHALGILASDKVVEAKREDLVAEFTGQTAPKVQKKLQEARGGVLFIDEAYSLARIDRSAFRDTYGTEAIDTLVAGMENMRDELIVIVAGYPEPMRQFLTANEGLQSRFTTYINFEDYSAADLDQIMDMMAADRGYKFDEDARAHLRVLLENEKKTCEKVRIAEKTQGSAFGNARDVRTLVEAAEKALAFRLYEAGAFKRGHRMTKARRRFALSTITLADVKDLSLQRLRAAEAGEKAFGFIPSARKVVP